MTTCTRLRSPAIYPPLDHCLHLPQLLPPSVWARLSPIMDHPNVIPTLPSLHKACPFPISKRLHHLVSQPSPARRHRTPSLTRDLVGCINALTAVAPSRVRLTSKRTWIRTTRRDRSRLCVPTVAANDRLAANTTFSVTAPPYIATRPHRPFTRIHPGSPRLVSLQVPEHGATSVGRATSAVREAASAMTSSRLLTVAEQYRVRHSPPFPRHVPPPEDGCYYSLFV